MTRSLIDIALDPRESLDSELTRKLLGFLLSGAVSPGDRLPSERVLSQSLQVGRQALRNAIKSLAILGVVESRMGSGTYFVGRQSALLPDVIEWGILLNQNWVNELIDGRSDLEIMFAGLAAERRTDNDLNDLRSVLDNMRAAGDDYAVYAEADARFHLTIATASRSVVLAGVLGNIKSLLNAWSVRVISTAGETATSLPMHEAVFDAVQARDVDGARYAMQAHMERAVRRLRASVEATSNSLVD